MEPHYTAGFESSWINDLAVSGRWLLAATDNGLAQIDLKNGISRTWSLFDGLWSNRTTAVVVDKDTAWVGTEDGICVLYLPKGPIKRLENPALTNQFVYRLAVDKQAVWVGAELGLYRLDRGSGEGGYLGLEGGVGGAVYAMHSKPDEIWLGRMSGIEVVQKGSLEQTGYPAQAFFGGASVNAVLAKDSLVWVGTEEGLWQFDRARNRWHQYTEIDGLIDNRVTALYLDGDYILIGTPAGMTRFYWNEAGRID
jgi:ligand-binding sensor domain-containing protein